MKRVVTFLMPLAIALPLLAGEAKKSSSEQTTTAAAETSPTATAAPAQEPVQQDSIYVQAAKRANRLGKKPTNVITNETLKHSKGHVTTTSTQAEIKMPALYVPESQIAAKKAAMQAAEAERVKRIADEKAKKKAETRQRIIATAAAAAEEGYYDEEEDDPATLEAAADQAAADQKPADQSKPPQP